MDDGLVSWLVTISIGGVALIMRLWNLSYPSKLLFDETYYPTVSYTHLRAHET
mgnify:FL=1